MIFRSIVVGCEALLPKAAQKPGGAHVRRLEAMLLHMGMSMRVGIRPHMAQMPYSAEGFHSRRQRGSIARRAVKVDCLAVAVNHGDTDDDLCMYACAAAAATVAPRACAASRRSCSRRLVRDAGCRNQGSRDA